MERAHRALNTKPLHRVMGLKGFLLKVLGLGPLCLGIV